MPRMAGASRSLRCVLAALLLAGPGPAAGAMLHEPSLAARVAKKQERSPGTVTRATISYHEMEVPHEFVSSLPPEFSLGDLLAFWPDTPDSDDLLLWLPGSWSACKNYTHILEMAGRSLRTICLPYDNVKSMAEQCSFSSSCWRKLRLQALSGRMHGVEGNNQKLRLVSALKYLNQTVGKAWGRYLSPSRQAPRWDMIRVAGHSQGAGAAAMIGYQQKVRRVVQFAGPCDVSRWPQLMEIATPPEGFYGFACQHDRTCPRSTQNVAWHAEEGIPGKPLILETMADIPTFKLGEHHFVVSRILPPNCTEAPNLQTRESECSRRAHDSVALGGMWPEERSPYVGVWQQLLGI